MRQESKTRTMSSLGLEEEVAPEKFHRFSVIALLLATYFMACRAGPGLHYMIQFRPVALCSGNPKWTMSSVPGIVRK